MSKRTKGPWYVRKTGRHLNNPQLTNIEICYGTDDECVADTVYDEADAHLIAAAPDLLLAVELMLEMIDEPPEGQCSCHLAPPCNDCVEFAGIRKAFSAAYLAIAKAKGEG